MPPQNPSQAKQYASIAFAFVALSALFFFLVLSPKSAKIARLKVDADVRQTSISDALRAYEEMARNKDVRTVSWNEVLSRSNDRIPSNEEADRFMTELGALAVKHDLRDFRLSTALDDAASGKSDSQAQGGVAVGPGAAPPAGDNMAVIPEEPPVVAKVYRLVFASSYRGLAAFVDDLPKMRRLVSIRSLLVQNREGRTETTLEIETYRRRGAP